MPFRTLRFEISPDKPECVLTAGPDDVEVQIRSRAFGGIQASSGFTFIVGGPELEKGEGGFSCFSGEFTSDLEEGDEIWVASEESVFQPATPVTVLVRSSTRGKGEGEDKPDRTAPERSSVPKMPELPKRPVRGAPAR